MNKDSKAPKGAAFQSSEMPQLLVFFLQTYRTFRLRVKLYELTLRLCRGVYLYLMNALLIVC